MSSFKDHFSALAAQYAAFRPTYPAELFDHLAAACAERRLAWDCACGSGQASLPLAERFACVVASDASPQQIAAAPPHARIRYTVANEMHAGLAAQSVDLVTVAQALHWLDLERFYTEVERVLKPKGLLAVWTYGMPQLLEPESDAVLTRFARDVVGPWWPPERELVETGYRTLPFPYVELTAPHFRMERRWQLSHLLGYVRSWSATARYVAAKAVDPAVELGTELAQVWGDALEERLITWPLALRLGRRA